ncbi:MAG: putative serine protease do-like protein [Candidatus Falkowbacteria bacterium GW2011_GWF2_39_8]|uniref:Putative serine protease do-like protein n=1 Tax=Candidatus Falkowbacteria bacterium GW2011_GWF2_39_8 TaxID=1618642 RepID=A0A0G0Q1F2_9BACT|nr:MAG: putative serine protease do-like protein [Candidatus Falkowbacteria bacterium GW2011_GWF2_39_8]
MEQRFKNLFIATIASAIIISTIFGGMAGFLMEDFANLLKGEIKSIENGKNIDIVAEESAAMMAVDKVSPAVVSVIVSKDVPVVVPDGQPNPFGPNFDDFFGENNPFEDFFNLLPNGTSTERQVVGGGSGFIITSDGFIVTNKHVVTDETASYTVLRGEKKYQAKVLARDNVSDLAILKIEANNLPTVELGESSNLKVGQTVIAIGNALGEFSNSVSKGIISGLSRSVLADGEGGSEQLVGVIQTDASINPGNSGGPLLNISGQVIGINTAVAQGAQGIGFAIPIDEVKSAINSVKQSGRIIRPWLGVRYQIINKALSDAKQLPMDYGALIVQGATSTDVAVIPGSPADRAGLKANDIIYEVNGVRIDEKNSLVTEINKYKIGEEVTLKVLSNGQRKDVKIKLEEMK